MKGYGLLWRADWGSGVGGGRHRKCPQHSCPVNPTTVLMTWLEASLGPQSLPQAVPPMGGSARELAPPRATVDQWLMGIGGEIHQVPMS